jgi:hypothetical protein
MEIWRGGGIATVVVERVVTVGQCWYVALVFNARFSIRRNRSCLCGSSGLGCLHRVSRAMNYSDFVGKVVFELCPTAGASLFVVFKKLLDRL